MKKLTIKQVRDICRILGVRFRYISDTREFVITGYFTDCAEDAVKTAQHIFRAQTRA